ncbi:TSC22 domain family protein 3-like [Scleropages formosus]|uniref:TSC22 domain family protein 3-like n=1 Tax=Scleropages formosus TaxID=113540 RepID=A0A0P7VAM6_SCLFO|nr:TSC22 domain family protein 3-like [Scleropages formosus]
MRCKVSYRLPYSPGSSPTSPGPLTPYRVRCSASGASVVAIDNKIEQAMDLVKSHLMYAVREEVEVLKEQIKELNERNSVLERENALLKSLANSDQLSQLSQVTAPPLQDSSHTVSHLLPQQPNVSSA